MDGSARRDAKSDGMQRPATSPIKQPVPVLSMSCSIGKVRDNEGESVDCQSRLIPYCTPGCFNPAQVLFLRAKRARPCLCRTGASELARHGRTGPSASRSSSSNRTIWCCAGGGDGRLLGDFRHGPPKSASWTGRSLGAICASTPPVRSSCAWTPRATLRGASATCRGPRIRTRWRSATTLWSCAPQTASTTNASRSPIWRDSDFPC